MIEIDGSEGEGGGQIVRTSVALSVLTGKPVRIRNIRAKRDKPGLRRQHLTAVRAAAETCGGTIECSGLGATSLTFFPQAIRSGDYRFNIGSAGSTSLVLQTVLPGLMFSTEHSSLVLEGGTHNPGAPPFDFLAKVYLPLVRRMGATVEATLERPGFYPAGGGRVSFQIGPKQQLRGVGLESRGPICRKVARAILANLPQHIVEREANWIAQQNGWGPENCRTERWDHANGPGNVVLIEIESEQLIEVFSAFGQKGVRAEQVAEAAYREAEEYLLADVPVGYHLADQLLLPCSLAAVQGAASSFRTLPLTMHSLTHIETLRRFLPVKFTFDRWHDETTLVEVLPA